MEKNKNLACATFLSILLFSLLLFIGCGKNEYLPTQDKQLLPVDPEFYTKIEDILNKPEYTFYKSLWEKAGMKNSYKPTDQSPMTILLLSNSVLKDAGYTEAALKGASDTLAIQLIKYNIFQQNIDTETLGPNMGSVLGRSLLRSPNIGNPIYYYPLTFARVNGKFMLDNEVVHFGKTIAIAPNKKAMTVDKIIAIPQIDTWSMLNKNPRFSILMDWLSYREKKKNDLINSIWDPSTAKSDEELLSDTTTNDPILNKLKNKPSEYYMYSPHHFSLLLVSNEAFKKIGVHNIRDLLARNKYQPKLIPNTYEFEGGFSADSLLTFHRLWFDHAVYPNDNNLKPEYYGFAKLQPYIFSYLLTNEYIQNWTYPFKEKELDFSTDAQGNVWIGVRGSDRPKVKLVEKDVRTVNGVYHVVDDIIFPKGFKF